MQIYYFSWETSGREETCTRASVLTFAIWAAVSPSAPRWTIARAELMLNGETKMFPAGFASLRVRNSSKAKSVFELLMPAMTEDVRVSCNEKINIQFFILKNFTPTFYFILFCLFETKQTHSVKDGSRSKSQLFWSIWMYLTLPGVVFISIFNCQIKCKCYYMLFFLPFMTM